MTIKNSVDKETKKIIEILNNKFPDQSEYTDDDIGSIQDNVLLSMPSGEYKIKIIRQMITSYHDKEKFYGSQIKIYKNEVKFLNKLPKSNLIIELFFCLMIWEKLNPHSSLWIKFDFENILRLYFNDSDLQKIKKEDFSALHPYGLEFRVVGSKTSIPCYKLPTFSVPDGDGNEDVVSLEFDYSRQKMKEIIKEIISGD